MGRQIPKVVNFTGEVGKLVSEADRRDEVAECERAGIDPPADEQAEQLASDGDKLEELRLSRVRNYTAFNLLLGLLPGLKNDLALKSPNELQELFTALQSGSNDARSDDLNRIRDLLPRWTSSLMPSSPLAIGTREGCFLKDAVLGGLLCSIDLDWSDPMVREDVRMGEDPEYFFGKTYFLRCLYPDSKTNDDFDDGYLQNVNLFKTWIAIFRSPTASTADLTDREFQAISPQSPMPAAMVKQPKSLSKKPAIEDIVQLQSVTPRSIAYAAVMYVFNLTDADEWVDEYCGFNFPGLYAHIVDYFEVTPDEVSKAQSTKLLKWWNSRAFPGGIPISAGQATLSNSRKRLTEQRRKRQEQARDLESD